MPPRIAVASKGDLLEGHRDTIRVPWWSFTKTVLAAAALVLVRDRRLTLDDPLPDRPYSLRHLLQHRAGLPDYGALPQYHAAVAAHEQPWPLPEVMKRTEADRLRYVPGQGWAYSNIGYALVRGLIERACGENIGGALQRLVLGPLGLERAVLAQQPDDLKRPTLGMADRYNPGWVYHSLLVGPLCDAVLFLHRLSAGNLFAGDLLEQMQSAHWIGGAVPGRPWSDHDYGLGLMIGKTSFGQAVLGHTGGGPRSVIAIYESTGSTPPITIGAFAEGHDPSAAGEAAFAHCRQLEEAR